MFSKERMSYKAVGRVMYDEIINNKIAFDQIKGFVKEGGLFRNARGKTIFNDDQEQIKVAERQLEWECFYLFMFLITYCLQRKFAYLGNEKVKRILDVVHNCTYSPKPELCPPPEDLINVHKALSLRYAQYYRVMKDDWEVLEKKIENTVAFSSLVLTFVENLTEKELDFVKDLGMFRLKLSLYIGELIKILFDIFENIQKDYEVVFEE